MRTNAPKLRPFSERVPTCARGLAALAALVLACGGAGTPPVEPPSRGAGRPPWIKAPNEDDGEHYNVKGLCRDQPSLDAGRECALANAREQLRAAYGVTATQGGEHRRQEYTEERRAGLSTVYDVWVLVAYDKTAVEREQVRVAGRVLVGVACEADPGRACSPAFLDRVEKAVTEAGLSSAPSRMSDAEVRDFLADPSRAEAVMRASQACYVLAVQVGARFAEAVSGEYYAFGEGSFRWFDVAAGRVIAAHETGRVKGGAYSREDAVSKALEKTVEALTAEIRAKAPAR